MSEPLNLKECAALAGVSRRTLYRRRQRLKMPSPCAADQFVIWWAQVAQKRYQRFKSKPHCENSDQTSPKPCLSDREGTQ